MDESEPEGIPLSELTPEKVVAPVLESENTRVKFIEDLEAALRGEGAFYSYEFTAIIDDEDGIRAYASTTPNFDYFKNGPVEESVNPDWIVKRREFQRVDPEFIEACLGILKPNEDD